MTEMPYDLLIVDHANTSIRETAAEIGATHMRLIATGHNGDDRVTLFALDSPGRELRVIEIADDSVWKTTIQKYSSRCWSSMASQNN
jgi:hypothetical protein